MLRINAKARQIKTSPSFFLTDIMKAGTMLELKNDHSFSLLSSSCG